ncbi:MAG: DUF721 domain-containing protein [Xanthomonadales bacterium]|nr:DUF721 domain-containing protein [Gammaproteobacteria bacterium]MBT8052581.1 DUF721 domain-containing protein [Gammaproteobacteria bacterium]NND56660.1 DUF721 domain-containing protein [Xanthomonadales bacterium]NNK52398.1 DUF721 domain-containing protein [Xanthomonadales bacterium]
MARVPQSGKKIFRISEVITDHGSSLGILLQRANLLMQVERLLAGALEADLASHFQVAAIRENRLILISPSASWATRLKMQAPQMIGTLHRAGHSEIEHIDIRVAPLTEQRPAARKKRELSPAARQALDIIAEIEADNEDSKRSDTPSDSTDGG